MVEELFGRAPMGTSTLNAWAPVFVPKSLQPAESSSAMASCPVNDTRGFAQLPDEVQRLSGPNFRDLCGKADFSSNTGVGDNHELPGAAKGRPSFCYGIPPTPADCRACSTETVLGHP